VGLKEQVTPEEHESVIGSVKELGPDVATVKVVDVVPISMTLERVLAARVKTASPTPESETDVSEAPAALLCMLTLPLCLPLPVGVKVMNTRQLSPTLSALGKEPQVVLTAEKLPEAVMLDKVSEALPVLLITTAWAGLVAPIGSVGNVRAEGVRVREPREDATPLPVTAIC